MGRSPSSRRAWIEITRASASRRSGGVALPAEGVDRNISLVAAAAFEGVDRNFVCQNDPPLVRCVALLAEGVDRNFFTLLYFVDCFTVALLAEGVDRNRAIKSQVSPDFVSPSSRRVWIEITSCARFWPCWIRSPSSQRAGIEITSS